MATENLDSRSNNKPGLFDRFLGLFSEVRPGEASIALLLLLNIFLILVCYYIIKTIREPLVLLEGGAVAKSYSAAGQALVLMVFIPLYSWFASKVDRIKLIIGVTLFFILNIELFSFAVRMELPHVGILFFIWVGFFSVTIVAQFWSYANDIYNKEKGNRLFPIIGIGMTAGAPVGAFIAENLFSANIEPHLMLHIGTFVLFASLGIYLVVNRRESRQERSVDSTKSVLAKGNGFALVFRRKYILLIAALFVLLNLVNTTGEFILSDLTTARATEISMENPSIDKGAFIGAFYGNFFFWVNIVAVFLQAFVVSRIVKYTGLRGTLLILPFVSLGAYGFIAAGVGFSLVRWGKTAENSTDYSIMNTARQLLWLPTSREEKYKAKQAVDTFFVRVGDVLSAVYVFIGTTWLGLNAAGFAAGNVFLILLWLGVAVLILREHRRLTSNKDEIRQQA